MAAVSGVVEQRIVCLQHMHPRHHESVLSHARSHTQARMRASHSICACLCVSTCVSTCVSITRVNVQGRIWEFGGIFNVLMDGSSDTWAASDRLLTGLVTEDTSTVVDLPPPAVSSTQWMAYPADVMPAMKPRFDHSMQVRC